MYQGGENALQAICGGFDFHPVHNSNDYSVVLRIILQDIKPKWCKVRYFRRTFKEQNNSFYDSHEKTAYIKINECPDVWDRIHGLLHEICHAITWKPTWDRFEFLWDGEKYFHPTCKDYHLAEYKAEKLLRKICRKYGWQEILNLSDGYIQKIKNSPPGAYTSVWDYPYMANRIIEEENIPI